MTTNDKPGLTQADGDEEERLPWERDAELMRLRRERDKAAETQAAAPETETQAPEKPLETVPETAPTDNDDPADTYARAAEGHKRSFSERIRRTGARLMGFIKEREKRSALSDVADQKKEKRRQYSAFFMVTAAAVIVIAGLVWFGETTFKKERTQDPHVDERLHGGARCARQRKLSDAVRGSPRVTQRKTRRHGSHDCRN